MALINGIYVHITGEDVDRENQLSTHSVESGIDITDTAKPQPTELSLTGEIVSYSGYSNNVQNTNADTINAWISLVKKDYSKFDSMSFERLNNELLCFENGAQWVNTGEIQYLDDTLSPVDISNGSNKVLIVKFEVKMPYGSTVRIQNKYCELCAFNIINKSSTGYNIRDYSSDDEISDIVLSNTYNGIPGRIRTTFTNYDNPDAGNPIPDINRTADWVIKQLTKMSETGAAITYEGRNYLQNYQIRSFSSSHSNTIAGGADFTMTLVQCRTAVNSYNAADTDEYVNDAVNDIGVRQISNGDNSEVWYTVQAGDTIWDLVNGDYANLNRGEIDGVSYSDYDWCMRMNPGAFSKYGDFRTLQIGANIILGYR